MQGIKKKDIAESLGISPKTLWEWGNESEFREYYNTSLRRKFEDINPSIIDRLVQIAYSKNENAAVAARKELLSRGGVVPMLVKLESEGCFYVAVKTYEQNCFVNIGIKLI